MDLENIFLVNIHNSPDLLQLIVDTIPYIPGWKVGSNAKKSVQDKNRYWYKCRNKTPSYFSFNMKNRSFSWEMEDNEATEYQKQNEIYIKNISHLSIFLNKIYEMTLEIFPD